jgi:hypothetical protein
MCFLVVYYSPNEVTPLSPRPLLIACWFADISIEAPHFTYMNKCTHILVLQKKKIAHIVVTFKFLPRAISMSLTLMEFLQWYSGRKLSTHSSHHMVNKNKLHHTLRSHNSGHRHHLNYVSLSFLMKIFILLAVKISTLQKYISGYIHNVNLC